MNPALIAGEVIDTMGNDHAAGEAGKIMIKGFERLSTVDLPIAIERSQVFLFLRIDAQDRVARLEKRLHERGQMAKLLAAMRRVAAGQHLGNLPPGKAKPSRMRRTMRGPAQTAWACRLSEISWGVASVHRTA